MLVLKISLFLGYIAIAVYCITFEIISAIIRLRRDEEHYYVTGCGTWMFFLMIFNGYGLLYAKLTKFSWPDYLIIALACIYAVATIISEIMIPVWLKLQKR